MPHRSLLIDVGNTSIKYRQLIRSKVGSLESAEWSALSSETDVTSLIAQLDGHFDRIVIGSVRSEQSDQTLASALGAFSEDIQFVQTESQAFGLQNSYLNPQKMGVDRWLAMLGAQLICNACYVVIDAGTAITADYVVNGQHQGGWIAPGFSLLQPAVTGNTARVTSADIDDWQLKFGQDTEMCLHFGCLAQVQGLIWQAIQLAGSDNFVDIIISGGDANRLKAINFQKFENNSKINHPNHKIYNIDNIVIFGLLRVALSDLSLNDAQKVARSLII